MKRSAAKPLAVGEQHEIAVEKPFRLDLTVSVLRRLSSNIVNVLTADGEYVRALGDRHEPVIVRVTQLRPDALAVTFLRREAVLGDHAGRLPPFGECSASSASSRASTARPELSGG